MVWEGSRNCWAMWVAPSRGKKNRLGFGWFGWEREGAQSAAGGARGCGVARESARQWGVVGSSCLARSASPFDGRKGKETAGGETKDGSSPRRVQIGSGDGRRAGDKRVSHPATRLLAMAFDTGEALGVSPATCECGQATQPFFLWLVLCWCCCVCCCCCDLRSASCELRAARSIRSR